MILMNTLDAYEKLRNLQVEFTQTKHSLQKKKEKCIEEGNMNKWGLASIPNSKIERTETMKIMFPK
jgi:hypothetical protein